MCLKLACAAVYHDCTAACHPPAPGGLDPTAFGAQARLKFVDGGTCDTGVGPSSVTIYEPT